MSLIWRFEYMIQSFKVVQIENSILNNMQWYWTSGDVNCFAYLFISTSYDSSNLCLGDIEIIVSNN